MDEFTKVLEAYQQSNQTVVEAHKNLTAAITTLSVKLDEDIRLAHNSNEIVREVCQTARGCSHIQREVAETLEAIKEQFTNGFRSEIKQHVNEQIGTVMADVKSIKRDSTMVKWAISAFGVIISAAAAILKILRVI